MHKTRMTQGRGGWGGGPGQSAHCQERSSLDPALGPQGAAPLHRPSHHPFQLHGGIRWGKGFTSPEKQSPTTLSCLPMAELWVPGSLLASVQGGDVLGQRRQALCAATRPQAQAEVRHRAGQPVPWMGPWAPLQACPWGSPALGNCGHFSSSLLQKRQSWAAGGTGRGAVTQTLTR